MSEDCSYEGFWSLTCDDEPTSSTYAERMLQILIKLPKVLPDLFPKPPVSSHLPNILFIKVFTCADSEEGIQKSAEAIRDCVDFPFVMYYFKKRKSLMQFMHTPDYELYKYNNQDKGAVSFWKLIGKKVELDTATDLLPSRINNRTHIHLPVGEEDFEMVMSDKGGKWILHCRDWESLDSLWKNLIRLYDTGVLVALKAGTPNFSVSEMSPAYQTKAILCYTADADCKSCVKRAADSIYICTGYKFLMYYKSNEASKNGQYVHEGFKRISRYMYTSSREMLEKDHLLRWKKINFDNEKHK